MRGHDGPRWGNNGGGRESFGTVLRHEACPDSAKRLCEPFVAQRIDQREDLRAPFLTAMQGKYRQIGEREDRDLQRGAHSDCGRKGDSDAGETPWPAQNGNSVEVVQRHRGLPHDSIDVLQ